MGGGVEGARYGVEALSGLEGGTCNEVFEDDGESIL